MQYVDVKVHQAIATITMDRPHVCNALNQALMQDLQTAFSDVHQEKRVKAVILTGAGDHFCAGIDLKALSDIADLPDAQAMDQWYSSWSQLTEVLEVLLRFPKPIVAAIDGSAAGAGLGIALACDLMVLSNKATLSAVAVRRGLVGGATAALLAFRYAAAIASRMVLSGESVTAERAFELGMCGRPVEATQIWVAANQLATSCTEGPLESLQANKRLINESIGEQLLSQLAAGAADSAAACTTPSAKEGIRAFVEKRAPQWPK